MHTNDSNTTYLRRWIASDDIEAPVLYVGDYESALKELAVNEKEIEMFVHETDKKTLSIKSMREMMSVASKTAYQGKRLLIIPLAERLSVPASHALLKTLEEPSKINRFLLVTRFPKSLLATILSRVQIIRGESTKSEENEEVDVAKLLTAKQRRALTDEELAGIGKILDEQMRLPAVSPAIYRSMLRLRDYYKIRASGGNEKLAADVLLASLSELPHI